MLAPENRGWYRERIGRDHLDPRGAGTIAVSTSGDHQCKRSSAWRVALSKWLFARESSGGMRSTGQLLLVLAAIVVLGCAALIALAWGVDERCPPNAVCDGKGILTALTLYFGLPTSALFGLGKTLCAKTSGRSLRIEPN
jgi:hypothetical protein